MEIKNISDKDQIRIINGFSHGVDWFRPEWVREYNVIKTNIITDGNVSEVNSYGRRDAKNIYFKDKLIEDIDSLEESYVGFTDFSFIIKHVTARRMASFMNVIDRYQVLKDITIYLNDWNDKETLHKAKKIVKMIDKRNREFDDSLLKYMYMVESNAFEDKVPNVYKLIKRKDNNYDSE